MNKLPIPHLLLIISLTLCFSLCNGQTTENKKYDYITIVAEKIRPRTIYISYNAEKYEQTKLDSAQDFDYNGTIRIIKKLENEGYEIFTNNLAFWSGSMQSNTYNYFLLRKERK